MRQFRDSYSGAVIFRQTDEERRQKETLDEMQKLRDEIVEERKKLEDLRKDETDERA